MGDTCHHSRTDAGHRPADVARSVAAIEARLKDQGQQLTRPRRRVLELLLAAAEPLKAYDLIARFGLDGTPAKPPTVYRSLDFLERQGLVHRIASISAYVACVGHEGGHSAAFLICDCCGATEEVAEVVSEALSQAAARAGYSVSRTTLETHGLCPACQT
jgi:Fe2+/Zn2+ uptake regulation proteins